MLSKLARDSTPTRDERPEPESFSIPTLVATPSVTIDYGALRQPPVDVNAVRPSVIKRTPKPRSYLTPPPQVPRPRPASPPPAAVFPNRVDDDSGGGSSTDDNGENEDLKGQAYTEKINFLKEELHELKASNHAGFNNACERLQENKSKNLEIIANAHEKALGQIELNYSMDMCAIYDEYQEQATALKDRLIKELEEQKKQILLERFSSQLTVEGEPDEMLSMESYTPTATPRRSERICRTETDFANTPTPPQRRIKERKRKGQGASPKEHQHVVHLELDDETIVGDLSDIKEISSVFWGCK